VHLRGTPLAVVAGAVLIALLTPASASGPPLSGVILITLDTTRADYLGPYGSSQAATPNLNHLASGAVVFEQAMTVAPLTLPAHCSLFTGLLPPRHGVRDNAGALASHHETLAARLQQQGFQTGAFVSSAILKADRGLAAGFESYDDRRASSRAAAGGLQRPANETVDAALTWLEGRHKRPFFLWIHLYDPHAPYDPPEPFRTAYRDNPYAGEIAFADGQVGRLTAFLEARRLLDRTAVIVTADHGESLHEHGEAGHGIFLYQSVLHVPLIIRAPGLMARRVSAVTTIVDVMPTILDLTGADRPAARLDGTSLMDLARGATDPDLDAFAESWYPLQFGWIPLRSLRSGRFKLIAAPRPELYDLDRDPAEQHDLFRARPALGRALAQRLVEMERDAPPSAGVAGLSPARDIADRLAALGYIAPAPSAASAGHGSLPDPKDHIGEYNRLVRRRGETTSRK
jgi:arylsulfatase A-like enzyme